MRRPGRRIRIFVEEPERALRSKDLCTESFCRDFLDFCDDQLAGDPALGKRIAATAVRLARRLKAPDLLPRAFGALGSFHRTLGDFEKSDVTYRLAWGMAGEDPAVRADLYRRRAYLERDLKHYEKALVAVERALALFKELQDRAGIGKTFLCRGSIHFERGEIPLAVADISEALRLLSPLDSQRFYQTALFNLATALSRGTIAEVERAAMTMREVRQHFRGVRGLTVERAKLTWLEGMVLYRLGCDHRAEKLLLQARDALRKLKMPQEIAAITADLARIAHPDRLSIRRLTEDIHADAAQMEPGLRQHLASLYRTTRTSGLAAEAEMLTAIQGLRDAATGPNVAPAIFA